MHSAIFWVDPGDRTSDWGEFLRYAETKAKPSKEVLRLAENVWLLNVAVSPAALGYLIVLADQRGLTYSILPFERVPEWLPAGSGPKTS
jgi:hypothetical protein